MFTPPPDSLLAAAFRAQSEGVFIAKAAATSAGLTILFVNESLCAVTGYGEKQLVGQAHGLLHPDPATLEPLIRWLPDAQCGQTLLGEGYLRCADGRSIYAAWSFDPVCGPDGRPTHIIGAYRNITEKRRLQESLVHSQRLDAIGRLAGGVAHDFNNLLSVINGYCEVLSLKLGAHQSLVQSEVDAILTAGRQGAALAQQLLVFGRRQTLNLQIVNLNTLILEHATILGRLVGTAGRFELELCADPVMVRIDSAQFTQVLLNLVLNARDALREGGIITLATARIKLPSEKNHPQIDLPAGDYVQLSVRDNGTGMDAATQLQLFEPFFTTKPVEKGTGLGLALVYGIVQQSGGQITVQSELLVGTSFNIFLPRDASNPPFPAPVKTAKSPAPKRGHEHVLLLESDDVVRKMIAGMLAADGYRVTAPCTEAETHAFIKENELLPPLLIASLAESPAAAIAHALLARDPATRLLDIGPAVPKHAFRKLAANRLVLLPKPFALSELVKAARQLLDA